MKKNTLKMLSLFLTGALLVGCGSTAPTDAPEVMPEAQTEETSEVQPEETTSEEPEEAGPVYSVYAPLVDSFVNALDAEYGYNLIHELAYNEDLGGECGFRTSGSTYEQACADFLVEEMEKIGLVDIEKVPVSVDLWQFDYSSLTIEGTDISFTPASYAQNGTEEDGITAELVDVGTGFAADYEDLDVAGKIVLAGIDQRNEAWIDGYLQEAYYHDAAALVTYDIGGYAQASDDIRNIQDICTSDMLPTVSLTYNEGQELLQALEEGNNTCNLTVLNTMSPGEGTSYTVVGKIPGKSSEHQLIYSGHYDKYFYGFQDDCAAIGTIFTIAKGILDSGYVPENDILIVCHGSEEWGATGSQFDWATGSWETINHAHPEWADSTLAQFNFELTAFVDQGVDAGFVSTVPEFSPFVGEVVDAYGDVINQGAYENGVSAITVPTQTMEDGISYRFAGVPYLLNGITFDEELSFAGQRYHTEYDDETTWSEEVFTQNNCWFGIMGILIDQSPVLPLDLTETAAWLTDTYDADLASFAGADADAFAEQLDSFATATEAVREETIRINTAYEAAYAAGDEETCASLREEGLALSTVIKTAFKMIQDDLVALEAASNVVSRHEGCENTLYYLDGAMKACDEEVDWADDGESGAQDCLWPLNGAIAYDNVLFSEENIAQTNAMYEDDAEKFWGTDKVIPFVDVLDAMIMIEEEGDFAGAKALLEDTYQEALGNLKAALEREGKGLSALLDLLNN